MQSTRKNTRRSRRRRPVGMHGLGFIVSQSALYYFIVMIMIMMMISILSSPITIPPTLAFRVENSDNNDPVTQAIHKLREKLRAAPPRVPYAFPQTKYRLAILLESKLPLLRHNDNDDDDDDDGEEISTTTREIAMFLEASAMNATHGLAPSSARVQALVKAATLLLDLDDGSDRNDDDNDGQHDAEWKVRAQEMLHNAMEIRGPGHEEEDESGDDAEALQVAHALAFETLVQIYLNQASQAASMGNREEQQRLLRLARDLCEQCRQLSPKEPVADEYLGATLRRLYGKQSQSNILGPGGPSIYEAYKNAALKSHQAAVQATLHPAARGVDKNTAIAYGRLPLDRQIIDLSGGGDDEDSTTRMLLPQLWTRLVRYVVLAAAAAREDENRGEEDHHLTYGLAILSHKTLSSLVSRDQQVELLTNAGICHKKRGETEKAAVFFQRVLDIAPQDSHAVVQLASLGDDTVTTSVTTLADSYVAGLFDGYSERFESELVDTLHYKGHEFVAEAVSRHWDVDRRAQDKIVVLDLGCGTGLLGGLLREQFEKQYTLTDGFEDSKDTTCETFNPKTVNILGVDLSPRMVDISKHRTLQGRHQHEPHALASDAIPVYDSVQVTDATTFLKSQGTGTVSIIVASDVLIYIGALDELFTECVRVLIDNGGLVSFTVESIPPGSTKDSDQIEGLSLLATGRFGHSREYIESTARQVGLELIEWKEGVLRQQGYQDVAGAVVTLRKQ